CTDGYYVGYW
nr:immunoglobulin heavy chain junction region [Mus musculus]